MKLKQYITAGCLLAAMGLMLPSCMDLEPKAEMADNMVWNKAENFQLFANQYYGFLEDHGRWFDNSPEAVHSDYRSDLLATKTVNAWSQGTNTVPVSDANYTGNYKNIYYCNLLLKNAAGFGDQAAIRVPVAEAKFFRAYCYFTLVRAFRDVPFVTEPVIDDTDTFEAPQADPDHIIDFLIDDLKAVEPRAAATYSNKTYTKSRMTQAAIRALIADMCLWRGRYGECIEYCDRLLRDANNVFTLVPSMSYSREVFTTGLSSETIFELNYNTVNYWNYAVADFYGEQSQGYAQQIIPYDFKTGVRQLFGETDLRERTSYYSNSGGGAIVRKYVSYLEGTALTASSVSSGDYIRVSPYETKWIVYRLPEIYLMKAEAIVESGGDLQEAFRLACISYDRANPEAGAGSLSFDNYNSTELMLNFIYDERQREFLYEGKRYFDLLRRITHHRDQFRNLVSTYLAVKYDNLDQSTVSSKLSSYDALYMPINATEMRANSLLVQNPFYKQSTNITN